MANTEIKTRTVANSRRKIRAVDSKARKVAERISADYSNRLKAIGRPISCIVTVPDKDIIGDFSVMSIDELKGLVMFKNDDGTYSYRTVTHRLVCGSNGEHRYDMSCDRDGTVSLYEERSLSEDKDENGNGTDTGNARTNDDDVIEAEFISSFKFINHVIDPMFAVRLNDGDVIVVFNVPTEASISAGTSARKPISSNDKSVTVATGFPMSARFKMGDENNKRIVETSDAYQPVSRYASGLISSPSGRFPFLLVANILSKGIVDDDDMRPSFSMMRSMMSSESLIPLTRRMPVGVSIMRMDRRADIIQIPMNGDPVHGVTRIELDSSKSAGTNTVQIVGENENRRYDDSEDETRPMSPVTRDENNATNDLDFRDQKTMVLNSRS